MKYLASPVRVVTRPVGTDVHWIAPAEQAAEVSEGATVREP
jgi:hypothetical protein